MVESTKSVCPQCGTDFHCEIAAGKEHCWCFLLPTILPAESGKECLCPDCLHRLVKEQDHDSEKVK